MYSKIIPMTEQINKIEQLIIELKKKLTYSKLYAFEELVKYSYIRSEKDEVRQLVRQFSDDLEVKIREEADKDAMVILGFFNQRELFGKLHLDKALELYKEALRLRSPHAAVFLGFMYETGLNVTRSHAKAREYYKIAVQQGDAEAMYRLGFSYAQGFEMVGQNRGEAFAQEEERRAPDYEKSFLLYQKASNLGHPYASCQLSHYYLMGLEVPSDPKKAIELLREAAKSKWNCPPAWQTLGEMARLGQTLPFNLDNAAVCYRHCSQLNHMAALWSLAELLAQHPAYFIPPYTVSRLLRAIADAGYDPAKKKLSVNANSLFVYHYSMTRGNFSEAAWLMHQDQGALVEFIEYDCRRRFLERFHDLSLITKIIDLYSTINGNEERAPNLRFFVIQEIMACEQNVGYSTVELKKLKNELLSQIDMGNVSSGFLLEIMNLLVISWHEIPADCVNSLKRHTELIGPMLASGLYRIMASGQQKESRYEIDNLSLFVKQIVDECLRARGYDIKAKYLLDFTLADALESCGRLLNESEPALRLKNIDTSSNHLHNVKHSSKGTPKNAHNKINTQPFQMHKFFYPGNNNPLPPVVKEEVQDPIKKGLQRTYSL